MVAHENRLPERDSVGEFLHDIMSGVCLSFAAVGVILEASRALFRAIDQSSILVSDLAAQLDEQIFALRSPSRGDEKALFRSPCEACGLHSRVGVGVESRGGVETQLVVVR
jgi:hypothetical protein